MALHKDFPASPYTVLDPGVCWFPADEALRETSMEKPMPPLVPQLRKKVKQWRDSGYVGAAGTSKSLLNWWFNTRHLLPQAGGARRPWIMAGHQNKRRGRSPLAVAQRQIWPSPAAN